jgi:hypothetical protein
MTDLTSVGILLQRLYYYIKLKAHNISFYNYREISQTQGKLLASKDNLLDDVDSI